MTTGQSGKEGIDVRNRCAYLDRNHKINIISEDMPEIGADQVLVNIVANGICGSDVHFYREGRLGNYVVEEPYIPGHECSGIICGVGGEAAGWKEGDRVVIEPGIPCGRCEMCRTGRYNQCRSVVFLSEPGTNGTFCDYVAVRYDAVYKIPDHLEMDIAALAEPAAVAVHAVNRCGGVAGKTGVILGAGPIGLLTIQAFKAAGGAKVIAADINEKRLQLAGRLGADEVIDLSRSDANLENLGECVIETAGSPKTTEQLYRIAKSAGVVVQVGWPKGNIVPMDIACFIEKELDYRAVNRYANAFPTALAWLADGRINGKMMITHRFDFEETEEAFRFTAANPSEVIKTIVSNRMRGEEQRLK